MTLLFLGDIGGGEVLLIMMVILLFFGSKNIPQLARGLGKGIREFKDATSGIQREIEKTMYETPEPAASYKPRLEEVSPKVTEEIKEIPTVETKPELPKIEPALGTVSREDY